MTWSGVYLRSTLPSALIYKVLKLVLMSATGPEVYVTTMTSILSAYYDHLMDTLNHTKSLKLKDHPGENFADCCGAILVDAERLDSARTFNLEHL